VAYCRLFPLLLYCAAAQATKFAGNVLDEVLQSVLFKKGEEVKPLYSLKRKQVDGKV